MIPRCQHLFLHFGYLATSMCCASQASFSFSLKFAKAPLFVQALWFDNGTFSYMFQFAVFNSVMTSLCMNVVFTMPRSANSWCMYLSQNESWWYVNLRFFTVGYLAAHVASGCGVLSGEYLHIVLSILMASSWTSRLSNLSSFSSFMDYLVDKFQRLDTIVGFCSLEFLVNGVFTQQRFRQGPIWAHHFILILVRLVKNGI